MTQLYKNYYTGFVMKTQTQIKKKGKGKEMATAPVLVMKPKVQEYGKEFVERTVLLKLSFGLPGFTRRVSKGDNLVKVTSGDEALYKTQKTVLDSPEFEAIQKLDNSFRMWLYSQFTQFSIGVFIVPTGMVEIVEIKVNEFLTERKKLIAAFLKAYPKRVEEIKKRLGKGWNKADYLPTDAVRDRFVFTYQYGTFEAPGKMKGINPDILKREQQKAETLFRSIADEYKSALRVNFAEMVKKIQVKLTDEVDTATGKVKQKRIHDSAVTKLQEFIGNFNLQNVNNDTELKAEVDKVRKLIAGVDTEALRNTDTVRDTIRKGMEEVTAKLDTMIVDAPSRKFRFATAE